jgi:hypothetical protein
MALPSSFDKIKDIVECCCDSITEKNQMSSMRCKCWHQAGLQRSQADRDVACFQLKDDVNGLPQSFGNTMQIAHCNCDSNNQRSEKSSIRCFFWHRLMSRDCKLTQAMEILLIPTKRLYKLLCTFLLEKLSQSPIVTVL